MYGRDYKGLTLNFEASGGLMHSSLVMQDFETDSYWAIMTGEAIGGKFKGTRLVELPVGQKMRWKDWKRAHPNTLVLSVNGREDGFDVYRDYFSSSRGFRGTSAEDRRLATKEPIFAFRFKGKPYAVAHKAIEGGRSFDLDGSSVFLYRPKGAEMFYSTLAFTTAGGGFEFKDGNWRQTTCDCVFNPKSGTFEGSDGELRPLPGGFDTFWYNWSLSNPDTELLK